LSGELTDHDPKKWEYTEHARVKHEIQRRYLGAWLAILGYKMSPLVLFDGFAGRGRYTGGEPGSPLLFWQRAVEAVEVERPKEVEIECVELDQENFTQLSCEIAELSHSRVSIAARQGYFADEASRKADELAARDWTPPVFWTADPFGFRGVPLAVIRKLMATERWEVMITFMVRDMRRFLAQENFQAPLDEFFGGDAWRDCLQLGPGEDREQKLLLAYSKVVRESVANFATPFRVFEDDRTQTLYYLIHLTNSPLGMRKMKEAMIKQSEDMTFWPVTRRDPNQIVLDVAEEEPYPGLQRHLEERFSGRTLSFVALMNEDYPESLWVEGHYRKAILGLEKLDRVNIDRNRTTPTKRAPSGLQEPDLLTFGSQQLSFG
jgi:three-Cys-motif partner protein